MNTELTKEQKIRAHELRDEDPDVFEAWLIRYIKKIPDTSAMKYQDFIYTYYLLKSRTIKINSLLGD